MAFAAQLGELVEDLIAAITSATSQSDPKRLNALREAGLRRLRNHNSLRTNQFNVQQHLDGLEERFRVLNRDGLADALRGRLDALSLISNEVTPESLQFLLELSDQPVQKSKLIDLESLRPPNEDLGPPLRWDQVAKEDGWATDRDLWKSVDFVDESSDDLYEAGSDASEKSENTSLSSLEAQYRPRPTDYLVRAPHEGTLGRVEGSQSWRKESRGQTQPVVVSELQALREVLFMLGGLQNDLFGPEGQPSTMFRLEHASWEAYRALLGSFGEAGRQLGILRRFVGQKQETPLMQVFRGMVQNRILSFERKVAGIQGNFVDIKEDTVVSLAQLLRDVQPSLKPLLSLSDLIQQLLRETRPPSFRYLELLFDSVGACQIEGDEATSTFMARIFVECFQVYIRPIRRWMEDGELLDSDEAFFISRSSQQTPPSQVWQRQYQLRKTPEGNLHAPSFLQPASTKIFITGKSVVILKHLGKHDAHHQRPEEPPLDFEALSDPSCFAPFSEIFTGAFEKWMQSKHHAAAATLRRTLFEPCGLSSVLDDLTRIYLMSNGSSSDVLSIGIFNNMDLLNPRWHDRFILTGLAYEAFAPDIDAHRITVAVSDEAASLDVRDARASVRNCLPSIKVAYRMAWPVRIVVSEESISHYQDVFTFLLQLRRATHSLQKHHTVCQGVSDTSGDMAGYYGLRSKLLWFCNNLQSYLTNLVFAPLTRDLREDICSAEDVDAMISVHSAFTKRLRDEVCQGSKLDPIRQCILDILDLSLRLEDCRAVEAKRMDGGSPRPTHATPPKKGHEGGRYLNVDEEEDESFLSQQDENEVTPTGAQRSFDDVVREMRQDFEKHLRFVCSGLRGVARASGDAAARKWDMLAEVLEVGIREQRAW